MQRLRSLVRKEFLELRMNPRLFGLVVIAPILQLTMLGYAATTDVKDVALLVADGDRSAASRELVARFDASPNFTVVDTVTTVSEIEPYLERGKASLALSIPAGYGATLRSGGRAIVQVVADGTDSNSTTVALGYANSLIGGYAQDLVAASNNEASESGIDARIRVWFNPQLESRHFMIPGVLALVLLIVTANLASMAIVREKELGTLEQLNVTPLRRWELIVGKLLPYGLIALVDVLLVVAVAVLWFEVPLRGSFALLFAMSLLYVPVDAGARPVHLDHLRHTATGDDDGDLLLPDTDDLSIGVHLSDREHAGVHPADHLLDPAALLSRDRARHFPQGYWPRSVVAPGGGARRVGRRSARARSRAQPQDRAVTNRMSLTNRIDVANRRRVACGPCLTQLRAGNGPLCPS